MILSFRKINNVKQYTFIVSMKIPYYRYIDDECYLLHSKNNISKLAVKLFSNNIDDEEYKQFIEQCLLKTKLRKR